MPNLCSIICVTYNHAQYSAQGLQSIFDQTYRDIEIIVLDDGSTDGNPKVIREALNQSPFPHKFVAQENSGNVPANFNKALSLSKGEYLAFLSLDDLLLPNCIELGVGALQSDQSRIFAANSEYQEIDSTGAVTNANGQMPVSKYSINSADDLLEAEYQEIGTFYIQGQVFRRDAVMAVGGFDDDKTGDDIILRTKLFRLLSERPDLSFSLANSPVFAYRKHDNNLHKRSFRQIRTVIEWKESFFPDRPYPAQFFAWLEFFFRQCARFDATRDLETALTFRPIISEHYSRYKRTFRMRSLRLRSFLRSLLKRNPI